MGDYVGITPGSLDSPKGFGRGSPNDTVAKDCGHNLDSWQSWHREKKKWSGLQRWLWIEIYEGSSFPPHFDIVNVEL